MMRAAFACVLVMLVFLGWDIMTMGQVRLPAKMGALAAFTALGFVCISEIKKG